MNPARRATYPCRWHEPPDHGNKRESPEGDTRCVTILVDHAEESDSKHLWKKGLIHVSPSGLAQHLDTNRWLTPPAEMCRPPGYSSRLQVQGCSSQLQVQGCSSQLQVQGCSSQLQVRGCSSRMQFATTVPTHRAILSLPIPCRSHLSSVDACLSSGPHRRRFQVSSYQL